jgi:ATP-binding cassette subfamily F protein uup
LDIQTLQILEDYLDNFQGILIVVSHDRYFLDRVVRKLLVFDNRGHINQFEGGYTDYYVTHGSFAGSGGGINAYGSSGSGNANSASDGRERGKSKAPAPAKKKFTFNEQREYDSIEDNIEKTEAKLAQIDKDIESSVSDFVKLNELTAQREEVSKELDYLLERYVYLTDLAEQFKG